MCILIVVSSINFDSVLDFKYACFVQNTGHKWSFCALRSIGLVVFSFDANINIIGDADLMQSWVGESIIA